MMMNFYKYQGTGNDFIILDNRVHLFPKNNNSLIASLCDRHFGIGADGLILLEDDENSDFKMVYFNADGNESTMCGNGGRCIVAFAKKLQLFKKTTKFSAIDGIHHAKIKATMISLQMMDVHDVRVSGNSVFTDTGSPHHVEIVEDLDNFPVVELARKIINTSYQTEGCNVNFVEQINEQKFKVRTYERGVEDETLACGTGVTAVAIAMHNINKSFSNHIKFTVLGGNLEVLFDENQGRYTNIILSGPAEFVFEGTIAVT
jgi:diaminopimelate epimerase